MRSLLPSRPVLWFLFLFNLTVAIAAPFVIDNSQGLATSIGMGVVTLGAGVGLFRGRGQKPRPTGVPGTPQRWPEADSQEVPRGRPGVSATTRGVVSMLSIPRLRSTSGRRGYDGQHRSSVWLVPSSRVLDAASRSVRTRLNRSSFGRRKI